MILFPHTRTRRLSVRLVELTLGQAIGICKLPGERHELTATELLRTIAAQADKPRPTYVTDPLLWTVEERTLLIVTYLAHVTTDGPDFSVGQSKLSDYVNFAGDSTMDETDLGTVADKGRVMRPLLGVHLHALESLCSNRGEWIIGAMACRIFEAVEPVVDWAAMGDIAMREWLATRIEKIKGLPESMFDALFVAYQQGAARLAHFFSIDFDDDGVIFVAHGEEGAGPHAPARFLATTCVSDVSRSLS